MSNGGTDPPLISNTGSGNPAKLNTAIIAVIACAVIGVLLAVMFLIIFICSKCHASAEEKRKQDLLQRQREVTEMVQKLTDEANRDVPDFMDNEMPRVSESRGNIGVGRSNFGGMPGMPSSFGGEMAGGPMGGMQGGPMGGMQGGPMGGMQGGPMGGMQGGPMGGMQGGPMGGMQGGLMGGMQGGPMGGMPGGPMGGMPGGPMGGMPVGTMGEIPGMPLNSMQMGMPLGMPGDMSNMPSMAGSPKQEIQQGEYYYKYYDVPPQQMQNQQPQQQHRPIVSKFPGLAPIEQGSYYGYYGGQKHGSLT